MEDSHRALYGISHFTCHGTSPDKQSRVNGQFVKPQMCRWQKTISVVLFGSFLYSRLTIDLPNSCLMFSDQSGRNKTVQKSPEKSASLTISDRHYPLSAVTATAGKNYIHRFHILR
ncbi:hypothetical protein J6590_052370 [Homalodisca vitripennis]|nr:hypothetical protein J6590_052370 [Homalodisca vitripennis]